METVKIAIVDDVAGMRNSLGFLLEREGYHVSIFENGIEILNALPQKTFDLYLLDICLPEMDGFQLLERVFEHDPDAPVVMMTGQASIDSAVRAMRKGAYDYLRKPFEHEDLLKTVRNVLEKKRLKKENRAMLDQLSLSEKRYRYIVQNSPDIIYTLDPAGVFMFVNEAVERILGFAPEELIGSPFHRIVHPEDRLKSRWLFEERRSGERAAAGIEIRLLCQKDSAAYRNCLIKHMAVSEREGEIFRRTESGRISIYGVARDVSYRCQLESQLREAQKMEAIGTLAGGIAHDFNNILMCIQGYASLMLSSLDSKNEFYDKLLNVERNVQLGAELTARLLGFARRGKYHVRPVDLNGMVRRTAEMFGRTKKEITIHYGLREDLWTALADEGQIEQVLLNLYVNAWQAMPDGGKIYLQTENAALPDEEIARIGLKAGNYVMLSVTDTGIGMDEEIQERIFEPFFTTKERGRGTGLGLASAYGILKNHGGAIRVVSSKGAGSTFTIYLPITEAPVEETHRPIQEIRKGNETVLLVDDEENILQVTREMLQKMGYEVLVARNGGDALDVLRQGAERIDLMILDMIMPGLSGGKTFDLVKKVRRDLKVLLSSGYCINGEAEEIIRRGCDGFIQKPYTMNDLSKRIAAVLGEGRKQKLRSLEV
jgi:PAS domain S-box-containing protein